MHMIANRPRDAYSARRAFGLEPCRDIHCIPVQVSSIRNRVTYVDPHAEADGAIKRLVAVQDRHLLLHLRGALHRAIDAVEDDEQ